MELPKVNWAEIDNDFVEPVIVGKNDPTKESGVNVLETTYIEKEDEFGKPCKYVRKVIERKKIENVHPLVEKRSEWKRFGMGTEASRILDTGGMNSAEEVPFRLSLRTCSEDDSDGSGNQQKRQVPTSVLKPLYAKTYRGIMDSSANSMASLATSQSGTDAIAASSSSRYIPPHARRDGANAASYAYTGRERKEDINTLRITNLSSDTTESDLKELTQKFGHTTRVFISRDRETNVCKGFAFVSYQSRQDAERALNRLNGYGYDNLILRVEWANPKD